jgi:hypothetical protein
VVSLAVYIVYAVLSPNGARGGRVAGLFFAAMGTGVVVFECLLGLRKRIRRSPLGRVKTWLAAHVWLGLLSSAGSGTFWISLGPRTGGCADVDLRGNSGQRDLRRRHAETFRKRMTELVPRETIYE